MNESRNVFSRKSSRNIRLIAFSYDNALILPVLYKKSIFERQYLSFSVRFEFRVSRKITITLRCARKDSRLREDVFEGAGVVVVLYGMPLVRNWAGHGGMRIEKERQTMKLWECPSISQCGSWSCASVTNNRVVDICNPCCETWEAITVQLPITGRSYPATLLGMESTNG